MASTSGSFLLDRLRALAAGAAGRLVIGYSGGLDSSVLMQAAIRAGLGARLLAVHVHHGLNGDADRWSRHCRDTCAAAGVAFVLEEMGLAPGPNLEARARAARHEALLRHLTPDDHLWLAHHRDDQAETFLLRLMRGAGSRGLGAMAPRSTFHGHVLERPLLDLDRSDLAALAAGWGLDWVEDPSNLDTSLDRNFLRHRILPLLRERWPATVPRLATAARRAAGDAALLQDLAELDLRAAGLEAGRVRLKGLAALSAERCRNALRGWIHRQGMLPPSSDVLERVLTEALPAAADRNPRVEWPEGVFLRYREWLYLLEPAALAPWREELIWRPATVRLGSGALALEKAGAEGSDVLALPMASLPLRLAPAGGGERLLRNGCHQQVSELWRAAGVPPWRRHQLPLLWSGQQLVAVAGIGVADDHRPKPGEALLYLRVVAQADR